MYYLYITNIKYFMISPKYIILSEIKFVTFYSHIMKKTLVLAMICIGLLISQRATCQQDDFDLPKIGMGISGFNIVEMFQLDIEPMGVMYVTFNIGKYFRIEPLIGMGLGTYFDSMVYGIGAFGRIPSRKYNFLFGYRYRNYVENLNINALCLGGEYYVSQHLSLSGEMQFARVKKYNDKIFLTSPLLIVRFYF